MFVEIGVAIIAGIAIGIFTGIIPGIHVNLVAAVMMSSSAFLLNYTDPLSLSMFLVALGLTHTFLDTIPSIFLGAPDADHVLNVLPGHRMLLQGRGLEAVTITILGSFFALLACIALIPLSIPLLPTIYHFLEPWIGYILIGISLYMVMIEKSLLKKCAALFIFFLSGFLGMIVFDVATLHQPLLAMLSGLFGVSTLLISLKDHNVIPKQKDVVEVTLDKKESLLSVLTALFSGSLTALFPGLSSAHAAILGMQVVGRISVTGFMMLIGGISTVNFMFSVATFYALGKARNGAIVAVAHFMETISLAEMAMMMAAAVVVAAIASLVTLKLAKIFSKLIVLAEYKKIAISIIGLITVMVAFFDGMPGLIVLITATAIGMLPAFFSVKRSMAMGCLLLPVIGYFV